MRFFALYVSAFLLAGPSLAAEDCKAEYDKGNLVGGAYGEMLGVMEGTIYGYAIHHNDGSFCLSGTPEEQVKAIADAMKAAVEKQDDLLLEDVPSENSSLRFLRKYLVCAKPKQ